MRQIDCALSNMGVIVRQAYLESLDENRRRIHTGLAPEGGY
jgi:hypothetical protein